MSEHASLVVEPEGDGQARLRDRPSTATLKGEPYPGHIIRCPGCRQWRFDWMSWDYGACERRACGFEWRPS